MDKLKKKNIEFIENIKNRISVFFWIFTYGFYMCTYIGFSVDSIQYMDYVYFFEGARSWSEWFPERGFAFPLVLWLGTVISQNVLGIMVVLAFTYLLFVFWIIKIIDLLFKDFLNEMWFFVLKHIVIFAFFLLNPLVYSSSHLVLTEFIGSLYMVIHLYYCIWVSKERSIYRKFGGFEVKYLLISIMCIIMEYQTKQTFFTVSVAMLIMTELVSLCWICKWKDILKSLIIVGIVSCCLMGSIKIFKSVIHDKYNFDVLACLMGGLRYFEIEGYEHKEGASHILYNYEGDRLISIYGDNDELISEFEYSFDGNTDNMFGFIYSCFKNNPQRFLQGYIDNYMILSDVYSRAGDNDKAILTGMVIRNDILKTILGKTDYVNNTDDFRLLYYSRLKNHLDTSKQMQELSENKALFFWNERVRNYRERTGSVVSDYLSKGIFIYCARILYTVGTLLAFPLSVSFFVVFVKRKSILSILLFLANIVILSQQCFLSIIGLTINRYMFLAYIMILIECSVAVLHICISIINIHKSKIHSEIKDGESGRSQDYVLNKMNGFDDKEVC